MGKKITVNDSFQKNYTYELTEPEGKHFDETFTPDLTPKQMLRLGIFDGNYFQEEHDEYPKEWFKEAKLSTTPDPELNFFKVHASKPHQYWIDKGWIHPQDPRGWFQWYCRYHLGRRTEDDKRQIKRWKNMNRHLAQLQKHCPKGVYDCRRRQRQALLHWAYDSRKL